MIEAQKSINNCIKMLSNLKIICGVIFESPKSIPLGTIIKLNGANYVLWAQAFHFFVGSQHELKYLTDASPDISSSSKSSNGETATKTVDKWQDDDYAVITWLLNSCESSVSANIIFLFTAKDT